MKRSLVGIASVVLIVLAMAACGGSVTDEYVVQDKPYTLEPVEGEDVLRVILDESAVERLGIETVAVEQRGSELVVPYDAVYLDAHGDFWVYTNPEPLEFVRAPIDIEHESSSRAFLASGPPAGTQVVTVGAPELYGSETEFDA
ncbi:MAG: hypothetical protein OEV60_08255 [Actinomycetota bacterium]|nr:hypothetical protein [Actinomycetota bacterium]MDH5224928.1 hypothetical protein [Actinomycetota bacterium]MDH5313943.1 hypothetical protein [Actinomycetota bacterium]